MRKLGISKEIRRGLFNVEEVMEKELVKAPWGETRRQFEKF